MLSFFDLIYNNPEQLIPKEDSSVFIRTIGATLFGFFLNEGYSILKEHKRVKKFGKEFFNEANSKVEDVKRQIDFIEIFLPYINPDKIEFKGERLKIISSLDTSSLLFISKEDISRYLGRRKITNDGKRKVINSIYQNLTLIKFEYERLFKSVTEVFSNSEEKSIFFERDLSNLFRSYSDCLTKYERGGKEINEDKFLLESYKIINPFLANNGPKSDLSLIRNSILIPISVILSEHRTDEKTDSLSKPLRNCFDTYKDLERLYIIFKKDLEVLILSFQKHANNLKSELEKIK